MRNVLLVLVLVLVLVGCQGISPVPRLNLEIASGTLDDIKTGFMAQNEKYLSDLIAANDAAAEELLRADILALEGKPTSEVVDKILSDDARLRSKQREAYARIRVNAEKLLAHYLLAKRLMSDIQMVLVSLERRKTAEDQLRNSTVKTIEAGVKAASKGGTP